MAFQCGPTCDRCGGYDRGLRGSHDYELVPVYGICRACREYLALASAEADATTTEVLVDAVPGGYAIRVAGNDPAGVCTRRGFYPLVGGRQVLGTAEKNRVLRDVAAWLRGRGYEVAGHGAGEDVGEGLTYSHSAE